MEIVTVTPKIVAESSKELVLKMLEEAEMNEKLCAAEVLASIKAVGMAAKDLHYRAKGESFYGEHLLADLGWQVERLTDDFIEVFYLGDKGWEAPLMKGIYQQATLIGQEPPPPENSPSEVWARRLLEVCEILVANVEKAKKTLTSKAGTQAALDEISKQVLQVVGLLKRNLK